jgi:hypothetical protein
LRTESERSSAPKWGVNEKKMFGGLAFLVGGNMAIAASRQGDILVRVGPDRSDRLVATTKASVDQAPAGQMGRSRSRFRAVVTSEELGHLPK